MSINPELLAQAYLLDHGDLAKALDYFRPHPGTNGPVSLRAPEMRRHLAVIEAALTGGTPLEVRCAVAAMRQAAQDVAHGHADAMEGNPPTNGEAVARDIAADIGALPLTAGDPGGAA